MPPRAPPGLLRDRTRRRGTDRAWSIRAPRSSASAANRLEAPCRRNAGHLRIHPATPIPRSPGSPLALRGRPTGCSTPRNLRPGKLLVRSHVPRQAEDALTEDVPLDLRGAPFDRVGAGPDEHLAGRPRRTDEAERLGPSHGVVVADQCIRPEQIHTELVDALVDLGEHELGDGALRSRGAGLAVLARPDVGQAESLGLDPRPGEAVTGDRVVTGAVCVPDAEGLGDRSRTSRRRRAPAPAAE